MLGWERDSFYQEQNPHNLPPKFNIEPAEQSVACCSDQTGQTVAQSMMVMVRVMVMVMVTVMVMRL